MKLPYVISLTTKHSYETSNAMKSCIVEVNRALIADDLEWGDTTIPPTLQEFCTRKLATIFERINPINDILQKDRNVLMNLYPSTIDLRYSVPLIPDDHYWKVSFLSKWPNLAENVLTTWKKAYLSTFLQDYLENANPDVFIEEDAVALSKLIHTYVNILNLTQLRIVRPADPPPKPTEQYVVDTCIYSVKTRIDHIPLEKVLSQLTYLEELNIVYGINRLDDKYDPRCFKFSIEDMHSLGKGIQALKRLKILRINRSTLDCVKVKIILLYLMKMPNIEVVNFAHCYIGDRGAKAVAGFIKNHGYVKSINVGNNKFEDEGMQGLAYCIQCVPLSPFIELDLRLTRFTLKTARLLASALVRAKIKPQKLFLSACSLRDEAAEKVVGALALNRGLIELDLSANYLKGSPEQYLIEAVNKNRVIMKINLQNTKISARTRTLVNEKLKRNFDNKDKEPSVISEEIPPLYLNEPEYLVWEYNPNNPEHIPGKYPPRVAEA